MKLASDALDEGQRVRVENAMGGADPDTHAYFAENINPDLIWSEVPPGTRSFALICVDPDAPSDRTNTNREDRTVPFALHRVPFYHWVLVDIPASVTHIESGSHSNSVTPRGKSPEAPLGRHGLNDYTNWFAGDPDLEGQYYGYDGPFPPWNDELVHRYRYTVFALDFERCPVIGAFTGSDVLAAIEGHVLAEATITATYTLNPAISGL
jgi:Raf kinase inhibitor-like YbhB/YbcL family protein